MRGAADQRTGHAAMERKTETDNPVVGEDRLGQTDLVRHGGAQAREQERTGPSAALLCLPLHEVNREACPG